MSFPPPRSIPPPCGALRAALLALAVACGSPLAQNREIVVAPDAGNRRFGARVVVLPSGNYVVTDPEWSGGAGADFAGAVYLYRGADGVLLSRLTGSRANDRIGSGGIVLLADGDFVVLSPDWNPGAAAAAGAATWGDAALGFGASAIVSAANSLVGSSAGDRVGSGTLVALANGSFVLGSGDWDHPGVAVDAGAATWCAGDGSTVGPIHAGNSLVGTQAADHVGGETIGGQPGVAGLASGHYVVVSSRWDNGAVADVGAVTWGSGDGAVTGAVSAANSLVGVRPQDFVATAVLPLSNGHYVVLSYLWDSPTVANAGAATWADGTLATAGSVTAANSLVGKQEHDRVGYLAGALANGNYVVVSPLWDAGAVRDAGAVTWRSGTAAGSGVVDETNSLVGSHADDTVGQFTTIGIPPLGVIPLPGGDYVVASPAWDGDDAQNVGAATWASGSGATTGTLSKANSLVGAAFNDRIAQYIVTLDDGNYVVASPYWSARRGATTWGAGNGGVAGVVSGQNSLVGSQAGDFISAYGVYPLAGGAYVSDNAEWSSGEPLVGAVTHGAAGLPTSGEVGAQNSIVGVAAVDAIGSRGIVPLPDGGFLIESTLASGLGAVTRYRPGVPRNGPLPLSRSLLGSSGDRIGAPGASVQPDGAIVMHSRTADAAGRGALTLFAADDPFVGRLYEPDTVRSSADGGGALLSPGYLAPHRLLVVGDPLGNRVLRLTRARLMHDGFEGD